VAREPNSEMRLFYQLLWNPEGSHSNVANLRSEDVDREQMVISYVRRKTGTVSLLHIGVGRPANRAERRLRPLPPNRLRIRHFDNLAMPRFHGIHAIAMVNAGRLRPVRGHWTSCRHALSGFCRCNGTGVEVLDNQRRLE
jgi:hypothetical protein